MNFTELVIAIDEMWLKGRNRPFYFKQLFRHLDQIFKAYHLAPVQLKNDAQRLVYRSELAFSEDCVKAILKVPGISLVYPSVSMDITEDLNQIYQVVKETLLKKTSKERTFKVDARRIDKTYPIPSNEVNREIGHLVLRDFPQYTVDVHRPDFKIDIRISALKIHIAVDKLLGTGGLPVSTSGRVVTMLSGGFDSPVASYLMSKRGARQSFIFFYAHPFVSEGVKDKILKLVSVLAQYQNNCDLYVVPYGQIQTLIAKHCKEEYRTIFFRRYMVEIANLLADYLGAEALITGDSLGQVSSQTIANMALVDQASRRPIFRPLIGFNKSEIIKLSKVVGTHDLSILHHDDACALFAPEHPIIHPEMTYVNEFITQNNFSEDLKNALNSAEVYSVNVKGELFKKR